MLERVFERCEVKQEAMLFIPNPHYALTMIDYGAVLLDLNFSEALVVLADKMSTVQHGFAPN